MYELRNSLRSFREPLHYSPAVHLICSRWSHARFLLGKHTRHDPSLQRDNRRQISPWLGTIQDPNSQSNSRIIRDKKFHQKKNTHIDKSQSIGSNATGSIKPACWRAAHMASSCSGIPHTQSCTWSPKACHSSLPVLFFRRKSWTHKKKIKSRDVW